MWRDASWSCFCILRLIKQQLAMHGWYIQNLQSRKITPDQDLWLLACQAAYWGKHGWKTLRGRQSREHKIIRLDSALAHSPGFLVLSETAATQLTVSCTAEPKSTNGPHPGTSM